MNKASILILAGAAACLCACSRDVGAAKAPAAGEAAAGAGYVTPPSLLSGAATAEGVALSGRAQPGARVRLASPDGRAQVADADAEGRWRMVLPRLDPPRLYGLSMAADGRQVQAQGYVLVAPGGEVALMRAGSGAQVLWGDGGATRITALDFDAEGGAVASGFAPPEATVTIRADSVQVAEGRSDAAGRFSIAFNQPLAAGRRLIQASGEEWETQAAFDVAPAEPVAGAPYRARDLGDVIRVDWSTPGGGLQSTLIRKRS
ncbi:MAG: hypothetical protein ACK4YQ_08500 [Phenylobacterium sp.]|uniref:hypothetical protein n=1 Tax=Phenylobacterium sp. TaxID=1871053 RepID=UPI00391C574F